MKIFDAKIRLIDEFTPTLNKVSQSLVEHEKTNKRTIKTISKTGETITGIGAKISLLSAPLAAAAAEGLKLSSSFQDGMAKVSTLVDTSVTDMTKLAQGVRKVSDETGMSVTDLAEAEYQALSASVDAAHVTEFLEVAAKGARAGFTSTSTAIDGLTTVINSYKMETTDAGKVMDEFLMTQNLGKTTVDALAQGIGQVATNASLAGVKLEDLMASLAVLTKNGIQTPQAITQMKSLINAIQKQSTDAAKTAQSIGLDFSEAHLKAVGFSNFLQEIKEKTGGDSTLISKLLPDVEGSTGFKILTADMNDFNSTLDKMRNSSGATTEAYDKLLTPSQRTAIALNQLKNAGMDLAAGLAPVIARTSMYIKKLAGVINNMTPAQKQFAVDVLQGVVVLGALTTAAGAAISTFGGMLSGINGIVTAIAKSGGVGKAILKELPMLTLFDNKLKAIGKSAGGAAGIMTRIKGALTGLGTALAHPLTTIGTAMTRARALIQAGMESAGRMIASGFRAAFSGLQAIVTAPFKLLNSVVAGASRAFSILTAVIKNPIAAFRSLFSIIRGGFMAIRVLMAANPIGLALLAIAAVVMVVNANWKTFQTVFSTVVNKCAAVIRPFATKVATAFSQISAKARQLASKIMAAFNRVTGSTTAAAGIVSAVLNTLGAAFVAAFTIASTAVSVAFDVIAGVISTGLDVFNGIIDFITGVFTGNWSAAWEAVVSIFDSIISGVSSIFHNVINDINSALDTLIGKASSASSAAAGAESSGEEGHWTGSTWFHGGRTLVNEMGPEIVTLPTGAQIIPHSQSLRAEYERGKADGGNNGGGLSINIGSLADTVVVREEADVDKIARAFVFKLKQSAMNSMTGAVV